MNWKKRLAGVLSMAVVTLRLTAATHYVDLNSPGPAAPYLSWATAATNIQDAVDAASSGDTVLVTDGVYQSGGRAAAPGGNALANVTPNRVTVTNAISVQSVNGPMATVIRGAQVPGATNGTGAVRCVYLADGASLIGFTLTNGATRHPIQFPDDTPNGGAIWCTSTNPLISNCVVTGNSAYAEAGGVFQGTLINCALTGNSSSAGGGAFGSTLLNCGVSNNFAGIGGGTYNCYVSGCTLSYNISASDGGGADFGTILNSTLLGNAATNYGGGTANANVAGCLIAYNAAQYGGGLEGGTFVSCTVISNSAGVEGGGAEATIGSYSTIAGNLSDIRGGGASGSHLNNCILTNNSAYQGTAAWIGTVANSLIVGNTTITDSDFGAAIYDASLTNCTVAGNGGSFGGTFGCTIYNSIVYSNFAGSPSVSSNDIGSTFYNSCTTPFPAGGTGNISADPQFNGFFNLGVYSPCRGGGSFAYAVGIDLNHMSWSNPPSMGCYESPVILFPQSIQYVNLNSTNPTPPFLSWATAATNIQDAMDAAIPGGTVLVTNGVYQNGGRDGGVPGLPLTNRVIVPKTITLQSVNGPSVTVIQGYQVPGTTNGSNAIRGVYLSAGATLIGFTVTGGATLSQDSFSSPSEGGGVYCESTNIVVSNCVIAGNSAVRGGAVEGGRVVNCQLIGNFGSTGSASDTSFLENCVVVSNRVTNMFSSGAVAFGTMQNCLATANVGGGVYDSFCLNSIIYSNINPSNPFSPDGFPVSSFNCCVPTSPFSFMGPGNITNFPLLMNPANGDYRLQSNSPCLNSGDNSFAPAALDLAGNPRISGGTVDIGPYEYQNPASIVSYAWLQQHGLPMDGSADNADPDHDGMNNWQEWRAGTDPADATSVLRMITPVNNSSNPIITWQSVPSQTYYVQRSVGLTPAAFQTIASNLFGNAGSTTSYTDTNAPSGPLFYRVGVP